VTDWAGKLALSLEDINMKTFSIYGSPGTGKTTELIRRMSEMQGKKLVLSFTRAAAKEIATRSKVVNTEALTLHGLCFRHLGLSKQQVVQGTVLKELSKVVGVEFTGRDSYDEEPTEGDQMLALYSFARNQFKDPQEVYQTLSNPPGTLPMFKMVIDRYDQWKRTYGYKDFTDMLQESGSIQSDANHLLVDEAQDLSNLQWSVVRSLISNSHFDSVTIAGDDDQAIYVWGGANPHGVVQFERDYNAERTILNQSWRIPGKVHTIATELIGRVQNRVKKVYMPRMEDGKVEIHNTCLTLPFKVDGSSKYIRPDHDVLILYRCHSNRTGIEDRLIELGYPYSVIGASKPSLWDGLHGRALRSYLQFKNGLVRTGQCLMDEPSHKLLGKMLAPPFNKLFQDGKYERFDGKAWFEVFDLNPLMRRYFNEALKLGIAKPTVRLSTIHGSKGMEADTVVLVNDGTDRVVDSMQKDPDSECRTFYVGLTRAKSKLHIVEGQLPVIRWNKNITN
jgi:DNA helicase-2/ATP-dependent DNA helicase PcrA